jgi:hypothetical protein
MAAADNINNKFLRFIFGSFRVLDGLNKVAMPSCESLKSEQALIAATA